MAHRLLRRPPFRRLLDDAAGRRISTSTRRLLLSNEFALKQEWDGRLRDLQEFNLGTSYEWITSVQKKFIGQSKGSAVDVDAAACLAEEADQADDLVDLMYKLRHTENTADMLESTEYAVYRFLLKHGELKSFFKLLNDPINYGVFMNEHCCCLAIDQLLKAENVVGAAIVATHVFKQEMFEDPLLNLLSVYALLKWLELPAEQRVLEIKDEVPQEEESSGRIMDDEEISFKFPYLRPEFDDGHFDIADPVQLVAKSLASFSAHLQAAELKAEIEGLVAQLHLAPATEGAEQEAEKTAEFSVDPALVTRVHDVIRANQADLEKRTAGLQTRRFAEWRDRRRQLIQTQAQALNLRLRLQEVEAEEMRMREEVELLNFFKERVRWEDQAREKDELFSEFQLDKAEGAESEEEYGKNVFEKVLRRRAEKS